MLRSQRYCEAVAANTQTTKMDSKLVLLPAAVLLVLALVPAGVTGIKCHVCSTPQEGKCGDPFFFPDKPDDPKTTEFIKECPADTAERKHFCRKIVQNVRGDERVIRSCGWEEHAPGKECYSTILEEYNTFVCACRNDGEGESDDKPCNNANGMQMSMMGAVSTLVLAYLLQ